MWTLALIPPMFTCLCSLETFCCDRSTNCVSFIVATLLHGSGSLRFDWFLDWNSGSLPYTSNIFHTLRVEGTQGRKEIEREDVWSSCHNNPSYQCYAFSPPSSCVCTPHTFSSCQIDTLHTPYSSHPNYSHQESWTLTKAVFHAIQISFELDWHLMASRKPDTTTLSQTLISMLV